MRTNNFSCVGFIDGILAPEFELVDGREIETVGFELVTEDTLRFACQTDDQQIAFRKLQRDLDPDRLYRCKGYFQNIDGHRVFIVEDLNLSTSVPRVAKIKLLPPKSERKRKKKTMDKVREHAALHFCMVGLHQGIADLDDVFEIEATAGPHMNFETTIEEYLIDQLTEFTSTASQVAEEEWKEAWEADGEESGYTEYVPTPAEKFNWQYLPNMAHRLAIGEEILLGFIVDLEAGLSLSDWTVEWEDPTDEHCRTFLIVNSE